MRLILSHSGNQALSVSRWAPSVTHILRVFSLLGNPRELDSVGAFTKIEGESRAVHGAEALFGRNRAKFPVEMELNRA